MSGRVVHFEIPYDDGERARRFYAETFGWDLNPVPDLDYTVAATGPVGDSGPSETGYVNGGMVRRGSPVTAPTLTVDVDDIDATLATVEGLGGTVLLPRTPVGEVGFSAYFTDSEGNVVGLWQTR